MQSTATCITSKKVQNKNFIHTLCEVNSFGQCFGHFVVTYKNHASFKNQLLLASVHHVSASKKMTTFICRDIKFKLI